MSRRKTERTVVRHPLDIELADFVEGTLDGLDGAVERIEAHLATCSLCRLKRRRLTAAMQMHDEDR